jgi:hypothetical protein
MGLPGRRPAGRAISVDSTTRTLMTRSAQAWGVAHEKSGAPADEVAAAVRNTLAAHTGAG